jgi:hypothetical protein
VRDINDEIDEEELYEILKNIEEQAFRNNYKNIKSLSGFEKNDLKLIINSLSNIQLDNEYFSKNLI